jgi:branched-chain amino acid aminotransferase
MKIYVDGAYYSEADAKVSVFDHGLLYGDGIFEGIRIYNGRVFKLTEHLERLWDSARAICLKIPLDFAAMEAAVLETVRQNGLREGYIRLLVTRGKGNLGLSPDRCPQASVIIIAATIQLYPAEKYQTGMKMVTCATRRTAPAALSPAVKSLN